MKDPRCGCCEGTEPLTPLPTANRPGLDALSYRVGTHATFLETMVARLTSHSLDDGSRPLQRLTTRAPDDPSLALLDAWATVADVLTFYQERIANESYLLTATERRSILELARLVGYRLRPGVAASVYLAFTLDDDFDIEIPAGTGTRSLPGPDELPQVFETEDALHARTEWNTLAPRLRVPTFFSSDLTFEGTRRFYLQGSAELSANNALLIVDRTIAQPYTVRAVDFDAKADHTLVTYTPYGARYSLAELSEQPGASPAEGSATVSEMVVVTAQAQPPTALARLSEVVRALKKDPSLPPASRFQLSRSLEQTYSANSDLGPQLLAKFVPRLERTLYTAYANAPVTGVDPDETRVEAMRVKAAPFGHNAPEELVFSDENVLEGRREWALAELEATLEMSLSSSHASLTTDAAFRKQVDLATGKAPPVDVHIAVKNVTGSMTLAPIPLSDLVKTVPPEDDKAAYEQKFSAQGLAVTVRAVYQTVSTVLPALSILNTVDVIFATDSADRTVSVGLSTAVNGGSVFKVEAAGLTAHIKPGQEISPAELTDLAGRVTRRLTTALDNAKKPLRIGLEDSAFGTAETKRLLSLDATYDEITPGSHIVVDRADRGPDDLPIVARVEEVRTISRADYGLSGQVTQLVLDQPWLSKRDVLLDVIRGTTVYAQNELQELAEEPIEGDVEGDIVELDGLQAGLEAGRWLVLQGERTDVLDADGNIIEGVEASELVMLAGVEHNVRTLEIDGETPELPNDTLHTSLILSEKLAYKYKRDTVTINANVVKATHGETQAQAIGSGDATQAFQEFTLGQRPLTFVAAATPDGVESTLEVRVNDVRWPEQETLLYLGSAERGYVTKTDDGDNTSVIFGDGKRGTRLPTGIENVTSIYRSGIGKGGNVVAGQISSLATRPLGVKEVVNPQRASGGADREGRDRARRNVPLATLALDRLVSVEDYSHFARTFAGIGKAEVASLSDGRRELVHLTIAGADDIPIEPSSDLYRNLRLALSRFGDPSVPVQLALREAVFLFIGAKVSVDEDYLWDKVAPAVRTALLGALSFERRELGQDVQLGEIIGIIQGVEGVAYVDLDLLDGVSETDAEDVDLLAKKLEALAAASKAPVRPKNTASNAQPKQRLVVELARVDPSIDDPALRIRPAQVAYLNPALPDTLVLTEVTS